MPIILSQDGDHPQVNEVSTKIGLVRALSFILFLIVSRDLSIPTYFPPTSRGCPTSSLNYSLSFFPCRCSSLAVALSHTHTHSLSLSHTHSLSLSHNLGCGSRTAGATNNRTVCTVPARTSRTVRRAKRVFYAVCTF